VKPTNNLILLLDLYQDFKLRVEDIAYFLNCSTSTVYRKLKNSGINLDRKKRQKFNKITFPNKESKYAWIAGIIDSEGCIGIYKCYKYQQKIDRKTKKIRHIKTQDYNWYPRLVINNTSLPFILTIYKTFGGAISKKPRTEKYRSVYSIVITSTNMVNLLKKALPYLTLKRKQAEIVLETYKEDKRSRFIKPKVKSLIEKMKKLNSRGVKNEAN